MHTHVTDTHTNTQQPELDLNGPLQNGSIFYESYTKGIDQSVPIIPNDIILTLPPYTSTIHHMYVKIAGYLDGSYETLSIDDTFYHFLLSHETITPDEDAPNVIYFEGEASPDVYIEALQSVSYENVKARPTIGDRIIVVTLYDGSTTNQIAASHTVLSVFIQNIRPLLSVSGTDSSYGNRFFPFKGPISAIHPQNAYIIDTDSTAIEGAILQLSNALNGAYEILSVTYTSMEILSIPIIAEARDLNIPFGTLWRGEEVPMVTSTIYVSETGIVGDVDVIVEILHSWVGDLRVELEHNSRTELLVQCPGGQLCRRDDLFRTTFDSDSASNVTLSKKSDTPGVCKFQSQGLFVADGDLMGFQGRSIGGEWKLHVTDLLLENDNGRLVSWGLVIQPQESHLIAVYPPVVPPLVVSRERSHEERHTKEVVSDGRITDISVHVHLTIPFTANFLYLPSLTLVHPDGTEIRLADGEDPLCAFGNYTYLVFDDRAAPIDYSCATLVSRQSGSGSGTASGILTPGMESGNNVTGSGRIMSGSGSGSGSGMGLQPDGASLNYEDIIDLNISLPIKQSLADLLTPVNPLSSLRGKLVAGSWTLLLTSSHVQESTLVGWSLRIAREPNIDPSYDTSSNTLVLMGADSPENYQNILRSIVYDNVGVEPEFLTTRYIDTVVFDGEVYSNRSLPASRTYITIHHIEIDLDPLDMTSAVTPDYNTDLTEDEDSIPILDPENVILEDDHFSAGEYILTITLSDYLNVGEEGLNVNTLVSPELQANFTSDEVNQELVLTISSASGDLQPIESFRAVLTTVEYYNYAEEFIGSSREISFLVKDFQNASSFTSEVATATVVFVSTNDLPVLILNSAFPQTNQISNMVLYTEGQGEVPLTNASGIILTDNDHDFLYSVTITVQNPQDGPDEILNADTAGTAIQVDYNLTTHTLVLSGRDSLENYTLVLGTVTFENTVHSPGMPGMEPRQITFVPFDGTQEGLPAISMVTFTGVNDPAMGDLNGPADTGSDYYTVFVEEEGPVVIVSNETTLFDADDITLAYITIQILNPLDGDQEVLSVMDIVEETGSGEKVLIQTNLRPETSYDPVTGTLLISGLDYIREYQEVLKTLSYDNLADEPTPTTRRIQVVLNDGHVSSEPLNITVDIELVNDSPFVDSTTSTFQPEIYEDIPSELNSGISIPEISYLISDDDVNATKGVAVVELDFQNGIWEYTLDGGINWVMITTNVSFSYALTLELVSGNGIRFLPNPDFNGLVTFSLVAWDGTDGLASGEYTNAQSQSETDPFSYGILEFVLTVVAVNDAPVLQAIPLDLPSIMEDEYNSSGDTVLSLLTYTSDVDSPDELGLAVVYADQDSGRWQFTMDGGDVWEDFGVVSETSALLLHGQPEEMNRVRFVPDLNFNGPVSFRFLAWDLTRFPGDSPDSMSSGMGSSSGAGGSGIGSSSGGALLSDSGDSILDTSTNTSEPALPPYPSGTYINTTGSDPVTGPFSVNSTSANLYVDPVNDSPTITSGMTLGSIYEDTQSSLNHGTQVAQIIRDHYNDVDLNPEMGLAVVAVDDRFGEWQYTCESPTNGNWEPFIGDIIYEVRVPHLPLAEKATLLLMSCWIRFLHNDYFNTELDYDGCPRLESDTPYIIAHGWDNTGMTEGLSGRYGNDATYANESDTNEYSANRERIHISVISVNNRPILSLTSPTVSEYETTFVEDLYPVRVVGEELTLIDNDHVRLRDITVTIYGFFDESPFSDVDFGSAFSGDDVLSGSRSGSGSASGVFFAGASYCDGTYIPVISSAPELPPLHQVREYVRNQSNSSYLDLYCSGMELRREELLIDTTNTDLESEVISWCPFRLHIFADPTYAYDAPVAHFQLALRTLEYNNSLQEPQGGNRTVTFVVSDNVELSSPVNARVFVELVNDAPILDLNSNIVDVNNFVSYTEGQGPLVLANESLTLIDHDNTYLEGAMAILNSPPDRDREILNASVDGTNITMVYENYTLLLSGNDTVKSYIEVLKTVAYTNTYANPGFPDERERQVLFFVNDGMNLSAVAITFISFTGVNNKPRLDVNGDTSGVNYTMTFYEEEGPVLIVAPDLLIHDEDNSSLAYITATILNPTDSSLEMLTVDPVMLTEVLETNRYNESKVVEVTHLVPNVTYDVTTATLYIMGLDTIEEYTQVLAKTISYDNLADEPDLTDRVIEFIASDGELESDPVYTIVSIESVNDSPRINMSTEVIYPLILEDERDSLGVSVDMIGTNTLIEDDDLGATRGIAVISVDNTKGQWQYRLNASSDWKTIRSDTSITTALLLRSESDNFVRFQPEQDFNGNSSIVFVAWDASDGLPDGTTRVAFSQNETNPFSEDSRTMVMRVVPVNDAPLLDVSIEPQMTTILEDSVREYESLGDETSLFISALAEDVDVDITKHEFGIAVIGADTSNGYWEVSTNGGANWTNIGSPTVSNAVVLRSQPEGENRIRFVPDIDYNGDTSFRYKIWDLNVTYESGTLGVDTNTDTDTGTFSVDSTEAHLTIEPVNDSPQLLEGVTLSEIDEDLSPALNPGTLVREIVRGLYLEIDVGGLDETGVAVVGVDRRYGEWQYTCDIGSGITWLPFIGGYQFDQIAPRDPLEQRATLLLGDCRIRFLPNENFNTEYNLDGFPRDSSDTPYVLVRGWDATQGENMAIGVDTTSDPDDHTNAFSEEIWPATIEVISVNDVPILYLNGEFPNYPAVFTEPIPPERTVIPVPIVSVSGLSLVDADNASLEYAQITFVLYDGDSEALLVNVSGTSLNFTMDVIQGRYRLRLEPMVGSGAPVGEYEQALRTLEYQNSAEEPNITSRDVLFDVSDNLGFSAPVVTTIMMQLVNDPPELDLNANLSDTYTFVSYTEGQGAVSIVDPSVELIDQDNTTLAFVMVTILHAPDEESEILAASLSSINITVSFNGSKLLLEGPATLQEFEDVIASVTYENTFSEPGNPSTLNRTIEFVANDGLDDGLPAYSFLFFTASNNAPFLDANGDQSGNDFMTTFYEEQGPIRVVSNDTVIEDIDNTTLAYIEATIINPLDGELEVLWVADEVEETSAPLDSDHVTFWFFRPQQYYNVSTATLRITGLETVYQYQEVLKTLQYDNLADEPDNTTRIVHFTVSDGLLSRIGVSSEIEVVNINDSPYFNESASLFKPVIYEEIPELLNPGWSVDEITRGLILDDDANSRQGIAIIGVDDQYGHWEITWDFSDSPPADGNETDASASGMLQPGSGSASGMLQPGSGSGGDITSGIFTGDPSSGGSAMDDVIGSGNGLVSGLGSGIFGSGSGSGSGSDTEPTSAPPPKCLQTMPPTQPPITPTFTATWYRLSTNTSLAQARVLSVNGPYTRIRFIPDKDFNGFTSFSFVAWDTTDGLQNGDTMDAMSQSDTDPFSSEYVTISVEVQPVNDAPILSNTTFNLSTILEDDVTLYGDDIGDLIIGVSDIDIADTIFGIAITLADEENGVWQFSTDGGDSWATMSNVCPYNATVLSSQPFGENRVRFVPSKDFNGYSTFSFVAWDLTSGQDSGTMGVDTTTSDPITGSFSTTSTSVTIFIEPVNDSPVLSPGVELFSITEDTPIIENNGTTVGDIVAGRYLDIDRHSEIGVAVVGVDLRFGMWEWRCSDTQDWQVFIGDIIYEVILPATPRVEKATLLSADCHIRFLPNENFNTLRDTNGDLRPETDLPFITIRAWDNTGLTEGYSGTYGVDTTYNNDSITNEFSSETENATIEVFSDNDLPVVRIAFEGDGLLFETQFTEDQSFVRIVEPAAVSLTDADHSRLEFISITVTNALDSGAEILTIELLPGTTIVEIDNSTNVAWVTIGNRTEQIQFIYPTPPANSSQTSLLLTTPPGGQRASVEAYEELLIHVAYRNMNPEPNNSTREIRFDISDSEDINDFAETVIAIELLNDNTPVLRNYLNLVVFTEGEASPVAIVSDNLTLTDQDHNEYFYMRNATIRLIPVPVSTEENISVDISVVTSEFSVTQDYDPSTGVLAVFGAAPVYVYEALLRTLVYHNTIEEPLSGIRTVTLQVFDDDFASNVQGVMVRVEIVNDRAPVVTVAMETFVYTEMREPVSIGDNLTVSDADSGNFPLTNITFIITNAGNGDQEILNVTTFGSISATFDNATLVLSGPAPIPDFQATMATLTYTNMAEEPSFVTRLISVVAHDGDFASELEYIQIRIELVNDPPVIDLNGPQQFGRDTMVNYVEGAGAVLIVPNATLTDNDHDQLLQLMVRIANPVDSPNEILFIDTPPAGGNVTVEFDNETGILLLDGYSSIISYQEALRSITYENTEANPGFPDTVQRMIEFMVFDGMNYSTLVEAILTFDSVNDPPIMDLNGDADGTNFSTTFTEEGAAVSLTSPDVVLFDIDNTSLAFVRIRIENLLDGQDEVLTVGMNSSEQLDVALYNYLDGTLEIAGLGLTDDFRTAVASVTYQNLADEPRYDTRLISFVASDGLSESRIYYSTVELMPVNDPPRLLISGGMRTSPPPVTPAPTEAPTDSGSGSGSGMGLFQSGSGSGLGPLQSGSGSGSGLGPGSGIESNETETGTESPMLGSGIESNQTETGTETPMLGSGMDSEMTFENETGGIYSIIFDENSLPVPIVEVGGVLVEDDDDPVLIRLEVVLEGILDPGFETVFFDHNSLSNNLVARLFPSGFTGDGSDCSSTSVGVPHVVIDLNETLSILEWEEVIQSLRYCHFDEFPVRGNRTVSFRIQDPSLAWSNTETTMIEVTSLNDAPTCDTIMNIFMIQEDTIITIPVLGNCFDFEETLTGASIFIQTRPTIGTVEINTTTGDITYYTALDDYGTQMFTYMACDLLGACSDPQEITIVISPVNDPPFAAGDLTLTVQEDTVVNVPLTQYFGDVEDDLIPGNPYPRVTNVTGSSSSSWTLIPDDINSTLTFIPFGDFTGEDRLDLTVVDSGGIAVDITIRVTITPVNDPPVIFVVYPGGIPPVSTIEDTLLRIEILVTDVEDREEVNVSIVSVGNGFAIPDRSEIMFNLEAVTDNFQQMMHVNYTPNLNYFGDDYVVVSATDSEGGYTETTINITVEYKNDPPMFGVTELTVIEDQPRSWRLPIDLLVTDPEDTLHAGSFMLVESASLGNVTYTFNETHLEATGEFPPYGTLTYYPPEHYFTEDVPVTFTIQACDNDTISTPLCTNATINVTILSDNDAPILAQVSITLDEDGQSVVNIWDYTSDIEEGQPPIENVFIIDPQPQKGMAVYNNMTGELTYTPYLNQFGEDFVYYNACDSQNHCSSLRGEVLVTILEVNDPPVALDFTHIAREDDFDLIAFYDNITDNETENLRLAIRDPNTGDYLDIWTTAIGGQLRVYHAHQIITYKPPDDYVGPDSFTYAVCDTCDTRRNEELGRVDLEASCLRQLNENGGDNERPGSDVLITCDEATVDIVVANINDVPRIGDIALVINGAETAVFTPFEDSVVVETGSPGVYYYRDQTAAVYEADDSQTYSAQETGLNLTLYNLNTDTDIDEQSLTIRSTSQIGTVEVTIVNSRSRMIYTPVSGFSGYDDFTFEICDKQRDDENPPRCTEASARVFVTRPGPEIVSVEANGAERVPNTDSDSRVSLDDTILITFAEDTNMPPYGSTDQRLTTSIVDRLFSFDPPFIPETLVEDGYSGRWLSPTQFELRIDDAGYPQPFVRMGEGETLTFSEIKVGEWTVSVNPTDEDCGGFDSQGSPLEVGTFCLLNADLTTLHSTSISPVLEGDFGLALPDISSLVIKNIAVEDTTLGENADKVLFTRSQISLLLQNPLSYAQLEVYCNRDPEDIIDASMLGEEVELIVVGCANLLRTGQNANEVYEDNIDAMEMLFSTGRGRKKRSAEFDFEDGVRERRQISINAEQPVASEVILQAQLLSNPTVDPLKAPVAFASLVQQSFNYVTLAEVIFETMGVMVTSLVDHTNQATPLVEEPFSYIEHDDSLTPEIVTVIADDPDDGDTVYSSGDTISIHFDRSTDQPAVASKADIDSIMTFQPPLGSNYFGTWSTPSVLQITILSLNEDGSQPSLTNFSLSFTPNYFHTGQPVIASDETLVPTETPWCIGVNVCGDETLDGSVPQTVGVCNANGLSCRANQGWTSLGGDFGVVTIEEVDVFPWWWILIAIIIVIAIVVIIVLIYFCYRYHSRKAQRKEALRVVRRWKKDQFAPGKEGEKTEGPKPWVKPPDVSTMRENPDPFETALQRLPSVVPRPPTAMQGKKYGYA